MKRHLYLVLLVGLAVLSGCSRPRARSAEDSGKTIRFIMSDVGFNSEIVPILKAEVAKRGYTLEWFVVNDIIQPNKMLEDGSADANAFQHEAYFEQFVADHNLHEVARAFYTTFVPSGLYSKKYKSLADVPDGATFGIPVDPSNNGRALFMLRDKGLLKLRPGIRVIHASQKDITENPHHFRFKEIDQLMQLRALDDVDVGFLFSIYALKAGFDPKKDALAWENDTEVGYHGIVAVQKSLLNSPKIRALRAAYSSPELRAFYRTKYGDAIEFLDSPPVSVAAAR